MQQSYAKDRRLFKTSIASYPIRTITKSSRFQGSLIYCLHPSAPTRRMSSMRKKHVQTWSIICKTVEIAELKVARKDQTSRILHCEVRHSLSRGSKSASTTQLNKTIKRTVFSKAAEATICRAFVAMIRILGVRVRETWWAMNERHVPSSWTPSVARKQS